MTEIADDAPATNLAGDLLDFQRKLQSGKSLREMVFVAVNDGLSVLHYDQAILWQYGARSRISIEAASGLVELSADSPYAHWLEAALAHFVSAQSSKAGAMTTSLGDLPSALSTRGADWVQDQLLHCVLTNPAGEVIGGMLFTRSEPFAERDVLLAQWMGATAGFSLWAWRQDHRPVRKWLQQKSTRHLLAAVVILVAMLSFIPIRLTALAPAEITPRKPFPITSPVEGVVDSVKVQPNQIVKADEVLVVLDDTSTRNRLSVVLKALDITKADLQRATNKSFSDEASKAELNVLEARTREKAAESVFLTELLQRQRITAPQGGLAIFSDSEEWRGRPVQPGERIMTIADPSLVEVTLYLSPEDAVQLETGAEVTVILNVDPLNPLKGTIVQTSYETITMPDSTLAYVVKVDLAPGERIPRIGLRGSAKVYAEEVSLGYYLLRKPILFFRKNLGV
ncbi:MAG: HlyD family efflux transporter periplasmic adaptor subunit [Betaproteobacteria bacterium]|nr:HlyD family efflux transporter periplasmic adaptor subunit [Betaproteobacteria bacterium]